MGDGATVNSAYDDNGNIKRMQQWGLKINTSSQIDDLTYQYQNNSNKLAKVTDAYSDPTTKLGDFKDGTNTGTDDYSYDVNGNLNLDKNKTISSIIYNHLNLPSVITVTGKGTITYTYDAAGNKIKKQTTDNSTAGKAITTITTYLGGMVYESKTTVPADASSPDYTDRLQFMGHEEGRIRFKEAVGSIAASFQYDYMLKDHLGNVRMVLTEEQQQDIYPAATLEPSLVATENSFYTIDQTKIVPKSGITGMANINYPNNNAITNNNPSCGTGTVCTTDNSANLYKLNSNSNKTGLGITLKVMAGDKLDVFGKSYYFTNNPGSGSNNNVPIIDLLNGFLGSPLAGAATSVHGAVTGTQINTTAGVTGINSMMGQQSSQSNAAPLKPKAFINVIFFDEQFKAVDYRVSIVGDNSAIKDHYADLQNLAVLKNGFVYIYCSNETPVDVFFDNIQVVHNRGAILEETHYYPFGLTMAGISSKAAGSLENKKQKFQGQEFTNDFDISMYEFKYRMDDCQTGRFWQVDPLADKYVYNSTYAFSENKVTGHVELEGLEAVPFDGSKYENRGESTQIKKPIDCRNCTVSQQTPAITLTVTKGNQAGVKIAGIGGEINGGSKQVLRVSDVDPGTNTADKNTTIKGGSISLGVVSASKESASSSKNMTNNWGNPVTETTTETTSNLSFGVKNTPVSVGIQNTETSVSVFDGFRDNLQSTGTTGPQLFASAPLEKENKTAKGTTFSISLIYKVEISVNIKQMVTNILKDFNTGH